MCRNDPEGGVRLEAFCKPSAHCAEPDDTDAVHEEKSAQVTGRDGSAAYSSSTAVTGTWSEGRSQPRVSRVMSMERKLSFMLFDSQM
jgi:hypothetical protein